MTSTALIPVGAAAPIKQKEPVATQPQESLSHALGRKISVALPPRLSEPILSLLQNFFSEIKAPDQVERDVLKAIFPNDIKQIILNYKIPLDISEAIREEIERQSEAGKFKNKPSTALLKKLVGLAPYTRQMTTLDLHQIPLVHKMSPSSVKRFRSMLPPLGHAIHGDRGARIVNAINAKDAFSLIKALSDSIPNVKELNLAHCGLDESPDWIVPKLPALFPQLEILDLSENNLHFTINLNGSTNTVLLNQLLPLKNLKKLIINKSQEPIVQQSPIFIIKNKMTAADKQAFIDAFKEKNPRFELIDNEQPLI